MFSPQARSLAPAFFRYSLTAPEGVRRRARRHDFLTAPDRAPFLCAGSRKFMRKLFAGAFACRRTVTAPISFAPAGENAGTAAVRPRFRLRISRSGCSPRRRSASRPFGSMAPLGVNRSASAKRSAEHDCPPDNATGKQPPFLKQGRFVAGSLPPFPATRKPFPPPRRMVVALASPVRNGISANRALASKAPNSRVPRFGNDAGNEMLDPRTRTPLGVQPERTRAARLPPLGFCGYLTPHEMNGVAQSPDHPASSAESDGGAP